MNLKFTPTAWDDYLWFQQHNRKLLKRINQLLADVCRAPFEGIGKPEPLKGDLSGYWSRRINGQHRLVDAAKGRDVTEVACRYHYRDRSRTDCPVDVRRDTHQATDAAAVLFKLW